MTMDDDDNKDVRTRPKCGRAVLNLFRISHLKIFDLSLSSASFCPLEASMASEPTPISRQELFCFFFKVYFCLLT